MQSNRCGDTMGRFDYIGELLDVLREHPLNLRLSSADKELLTLDLEEKNINIDIRDPGELVKIIKMLKSVIEDRR